MFFFLKTALIILLSVIGHLNYHIFMVYQLLMASINHIITFFIIYKKYFFIFFTLAKHNDILNIILPDHFPEIIKSSLQRTLSCDEKFFIIHTRLKKNYYNKNCNPTSIYIFSTLIRNLIFFILVLIVFL